MTVHLVGAGPGNADMLTRRAERLLRTADVVVHDRLVGVDVLALCGPSATLIDVGKRPGSHRNSQQFINDTLIAHGRRHDTVVRLKGGDPFVFGRGGEEAEALGAAGVEVEVVPGISSALAGPAIAGIPVTHRSHSSGFTVVTAHEDPSTDASLDWDALARLETTLVILMGAARAAAVRDRLLTAGMDPDTPVAIVTAASRHDQQTARLALGDLGATPVRAPSLIVVGAVAALDVTADAKAQALDPDLFASGPEPIARLEGVTP